MSLPPLLELHNATVIKDNLRVLDALSLTIGLGEHTAILGPNGSGKSSLIKLLTHQYYPLYNADEIPAVRVLGEDLWNIFELRTMLGIVSADFHHGLVEGNNAGRITGRDAVISGFFASHGTFGHQQITDAMRRQADDALALMEATHLATKWLNQMSTGEARRILIARALVIAPRALLLDEPTTGLDLVAMHRCMEIVRRIAQRGTSLILVTHHVNEIIPEIERVIMLRDGRVALDGPKAEVLTSANVSGVYDAPVHVTERGGYYEMRLA